MRVRIKNILPVMKRIKVLEVVVFILLVGCAPGPILRFGLDATENEYLWGGYKYGQVYKLKYDMFLEVDKSYPLKYERVTIKPPGNLVGMIISYIPQTVSEYKKSPGKFIKVKGIIRKGTNIKCSRLIKYIPVGFDSSLYPFAKILDGEFAGVEVMISAISLTEEDEKTGIFLDEPNLDLLVKVD